MCEPLSASPGHGQQPHVPVHREDAEAAAAGGGQTAGGRTLGPGRPAVASSVATPATVGPLLLPHRGGAMSYPQELDEALRAHAHLSAELTQQLQCPPHYARSNDTSSH